MKLESVRLMFSEDANEKSFVSLKQVKKQTKSLCRELNQISRTIQEDCEENRWMIENAPLLLSSLHLIGFREFLAKEKTFILVKQYIDNPEADFSKEEILAFFECFGAAISSDEKELFSIRSVFLLQLATMILDSFRQNKKQIPRLFTVFHKIRSIDFESFAEMISPIERLFRQDPSGIYSKMTKSSQSLYKSKLRKEAKQKKEKGVDLLSKKLEIAKRNKTHIGFFLDFSRRRFPYYPILFLLTFLLWAEFFLSIHSALLSLLILIPLYFFTKQLIDFILGIFLQEPPLPGLKLDLIGPSEKTCVVIPALITSKKEIDKLFYNLRQYQINNYAENESIMFGLLCDLAESKTAKNSKDDELKRYLEEKTKEYNELEPIFFSCLRRRIFHRSEEKYVGWERKRGAIEQFIGYLRGETWEDATVFGNIEQFTETKYVITLDADTRLMIGQARRLVGIASHPLNQPVIEKKNGKYRVIKGHGILQPKITTSLLEPIQSSFGKLFGNGSGNVLYASAAFDLMQSVFGEGNFCGKGILSVDAYYKVISGELPQQTILSHDMPEGALLHCGLISNEYFADTNPQDAISFYKRQHRWIRGDVQNFSILNRLSAMRKCFAVENVLRYTVPLFELSVVIASCFYRGWQGIVCSLLVIFFHFENLLISTVKALFSGNVELLYRRFSEKMRNVMINTFYLSLFQLSAVAFEAYYYSDAILRSLFRLMISKKKLLEWQVYSPVSKSKNELLFFLPSSVIATFLMLISNNAPLNIILLLWFAFPVICKGISSPEKRRREWKKSELDRMKRYAEAEFRFFDESVTQQTNFLPPDNIQYEPIEKIAMRTSPTNIGMYLASLVAAFDLGFLDQKQMIQKLKRSKKSIDRLKRWKGHLYNWYDLNTLGVIGGNFVSTVDSGNYFASVICVIQALKELNSFDSEVQNLIDSFEEEIEQVDFTPLFHFEKALFRVGYNVQEESGTENDYDLYVSEARITSFLAIALGQISPFHWQKLSKPLLSFKGRAGLGSWSGTCFEYFMPPLFLPVIENSMEDETLSYALFCQERSCAYASPGRKVYGISESAYHITDSQENYQYKAFGVPALTIQSKEESGKVISPYSSFLMLERRSRSVLKNLDALEHLGMKGPFGFYESCVFHSNFIDDFEMIRSYMAHHKGMSILALTNEILEDRFPKRLLSYRDFSAKVELLAERFPLEGKIYKKKPEKRRFQTKNSEQNELVFPLSEPIVHSHLITDGKMTLQISNNGLNRMICRNLDLFDREKGGLRFSINIAGEEYAFDSTPNGIKRICFGTHFVEYSLVVGKALAIVRLQQLPGKSSFLIRGEINGCSENCDFLMSFSPILQNEREYRAHPAFHNLSLEASTSANKCLIRRRGVDHHRCLHFELTENFDFLVDGAVCEKNMRNRILIKPDCSIRIPFSDGISNSFAISVSFDDNEDSDSALRILDGSYRLPLEWGQKSERKAEHFESICFYDDFCRELENRILCQTEKSTHFILGEKVSSLSKESLWKFGISGDFPMISYYVSHNNEEDFKNVSALIRVTKKLLLSGILIDTVMIHKESKEYFDETRERLSELITFYRCEFLLGKHPGIHFIACDNEIECRRILSAGQFQLFGDQEAPKLENETWIPIQNEYQACTETQTGSFVDRGFLIKKNEFNPPVPFSHIVSNRMVGFVCDQNSLGFTWFRNSGLNRITKWENCPTDSTGEKIYLQYNNLYYDLLQMSTQVEYGNHFVAYQGEVDGNQYKIFATVSEEISGKLILIHLSEALTASAKIVYSFMPVVSNFPNQNIMVEMKNNAVIFQPCFTGEYSSYGFFALRDQTPALHQRGDRLEIRFQAEKEAVCLLGGYSSEKHLEFVMKTFENVSLDELLNREKEFYEPYFQDVRNTKEFWIRYQLIHGRVYGRTGLYQSSGAYGFRDQLQDSLAFLKFAPQVTKKQIIRCAAHQFEEGDVQHWWHTIRGSGKEDPGIRSRCSDDYLWLVFAVSEYIKKSGDEDILNYSIPFLKAEPLSDEDERYFRPQKGEYAPLVEHLKRSVTLVINRGLGNHNLPFIGSGDWNDGMNLVGGESVWLGFFVAICLNRIKRYLDLETQESVKQFLAKLHLGLQSAFNGLWFLRVIREDGSILGNDCSLESECSIDLITQAFAAFYYLEFTNENILIQEDNVKSALQCSFDILFDKKSRTTALFQKPFVNTEPSPGYIQRYCAGVRENGGQYTHAAVWFALALLRLGRKLGDQALMIQAKEIAESLSPFEKAKYENFLRYQREPYVLCGDVYTAKGLKGHGGWSWYTGAAGWFLTLLDELDEEKTSG